MRPRRSYGNLKRTQAQKRTAVLQMLTFRQSIEDLTAEGVARSYGIGVGEAQAMIEGERLRRLRR